MFPRGAEAQNWHLDMQLTGKVVLSAVVLLLVSAAYGLYKSRPARAPQKGGNPEARAEKEAEGSGQPAVQSASPATLQRRPRRQRASHGAGAPVGCSSEDPGGPRVLAPGAPCRHKKPPSEGGQCSGSEQVPPCCCGQEAGTAVGGIWSEVSSLNQARPHCQLVALDGHLYAIGGECLNTVERYDPRRDHWTFAPPLPSDTFALAHTATACADEIFVTGGSLRYLLLRFSAQDQRWWAGPTGGGKDRTAEMVAVDGFLYRFDLNRSLGISVHRCRASTRLWYECATFRTPYPDAFQCAVVGARVYCVGRRRTLCFLADHVSPSSHPTGPGRTSPCLSGSACLCHLYLEELGGPIPLWGRRCPGPVQGCGQKLRDESAGRRRLQGARS